MNNVSIKSLPTPVPKRARLSFQFIFLLDHRILDSGRLVFSSSPVDIVHVTDGVQDQKH